MQFKWVIMQMVQLLPIMANDKGMVVEICYIIRSIAKDSRDRRHMQKIAGDIQAIDKISELLLNERN